MAARRFHALQAADDRDTGALTTREEPGMTCRPRPVWPAPEAEGAHAAAAAAAGSIARLGLSV